MKNPDLFNQAQEMQKIEQENWKMMAKKDEYNLKIQYEKQKIDFDKWKICETDAFCLHNFDQKSNSQPDEQYTAYLPNLISFS